MTSDIYEPEAQNSVYPCDYNTHCKLTSYAQNLHFGQLCKANKPCNHEEMAAFSKNPSKQQDVFTRFQTYPELK